MLGLMENTKVETCRNSVQFVQNVPFQGSLSLFKILMKSSRKSSLCISALIFSYREVLIVFEDIRFFTYVYSAMVLLYGGLTTEV